LRENGGASSGLCGHSIRIVFTHRELTLIESTLLSSYYIQSAISKSCTYGLYRHIEQFTVVRSWSWNLSQKGSSDFLF
jgi:hypothetical protein